MTKIIRAYQRVLLNKGLKEDTTVAYYSRYNQYFVKFCKLIGDPSSVLILSGSDVYKCFINKFVNVFVKSTVNMS